MGKMFFITFGIATVSGPPENANWHLRSIGGDGPKESVPLSTPTRRRRHPVYGHGRANACGKGSCNCGLG
jgi:hypothetical protein